MWLNIQCHGIKSKLKYNGRQPEHKGSTTTLLTAPRHKVQTEIQAETFSMRLNFFYRLAYPIVT